MFFVGINRLLLLLLLLISSTAFAVDQLILLPHQKLPVEHLYNSTQKGLLIAHSLGSGKTILSIGFTEKYPDKPVYIILPYFLKSNWSIVMERYGMKGRSNYMLLSYEEAAEKLIHVNLDEAIVVIDEVHKLLSFIRSPVDAIRQKYVRLYLQLKKSFKILALTATPLYQDAIDLSYIINLVAGENIMPFNKHQFQLNYTRINRARSLWRGHLTESLYLKSFFPSFLSFYGVSFVTGSIASPLVGFGFGIGGSIIFPILNACWPLDTYKLRSFDPEKLKGIIQRYVSFYEVPLADKESYPNVCFVNESVKLSRKEYAFLLRLADKNLDKEELKLLLLESYGTFDEDDLIINSTLIQENLLNLPGVGRQITNMIFKNKDNKDKYPEKFKQLLEYLNRGTYPAVIYTNYYRTGLLNIRKFLDEYGYKNKYKVLDPTISVSDQIAIINDYNEGKVPLLLLHPDITEGISLKGTQVFHILEQVLNVALLDQIMGRVIRYQSHTHLPKDKQTVNIILWRGVLSGISLKHFKQQKQNWRTSFSELNTFSIYGTGRVQIDRDNAKKDRAPDDAANDNLSQLATEIKKLKDVFKTYSIESHYK